MGIGGVLKPNDPLLVKVGSDYSQIFRHKSEDANGNRTPVNITSYTIRMKIKEDYVDTVATFDLSTTNGKITITDATNGEFTITLTDTETGTVRMNRRQMAGAVPTKTFVFDIELVDGSGKVTPFLIGTMQFYAEVTD